MTDIKELFETTSSGNPPPVKIEGDPLSFKNLSVKSLNGVVSFAPNTGSHSLPGNQIAFGQEGNRGIEIGLNIPASKVVLTYLIGKGIDPNYPYTTITYYDAQGSDVGSKVLFGNGKDDTIATIDSPPSQTKITRIVIRADGNGYWACVNDFVMTI